MTAEKKKYKKGDWVFHLYHGVGEVEGVEEKELGGDIETYYKVKARNGVYWIPIEEEESERIRPVASNKELKRALNILKSPPEEMADKHTTRKSRITQVTKEGELVGFCALLRDLQAKRISDKLNTTEQRAHRKLKKKIASEWAATKGITVHEATKKLNSILRDISPEGEEEG
ncbi:MAG: CarD family transcriptional regulator [Anaerolineales bacterium]